MLSLTQAPFRHQPVLVLGATGFIGCWVARLLTQQGADLALVVRDRPAAATCFNQYGVKGEIFVQDLCDTERLQPLVRLVRPAVIFNLAGYGIDRTERDEGLAYRLNAELPRKLSQIVAANGNRYWPGQQLVHAGSALEYGDISGNVSEDSQPHPTTLYGRSKLRGTEAISTICREHGLRAVIGRLFTVYGPGELPARLLPTLLAACHSREDLSLTAGEQRRDFTFVAEAAEGLLRLALVPDAAGPIVNLATGHLLPVREFIETAAHVLKIEPARLRFGALPTRPEEQNHDHPSIARLRQLTGWQPQITIAEGIRQTVAFNKGNAYSKGDL